MSDLNQTAFGLWLPASVAGRFRPERTRGPVLRWVCRKSDQGGMKSSAGDFWDRLQTAHPIHTIRRLAGINLCLEIDRLETGLQRFAAARYVRPEYRSLSAPTANQPVEGAFFARAGVLTAIKSLIAATPFADFPPPFDPFVVGDLSLDANEIAFANPRGGVDTLDDFDVAVQSVSVWDIYNPRFLGYALARAYRMIEIVQGNDEKVVRLRTRLGWNTQPLSFEGMSLDEFAAVVFGLFSHVHQRATPSLMLGEPGGCVIDANSFLSQTALSQELLTKFLRGRSLTIEKFRARVAEDASWNRSEFIGRAGIPGFCTDYRVFRECPLMDLGAGQHLILDLQFLEELVGTGLFFHLLNQLPPGKRKTLFDLWGRVFELLVIELLEHYYPCPASSVMPRVLLSEHHFQGTRADGAKEGEVDALLDFGSEIILFEFKHFFLAQDVKDALDRTRLESELQLKLVEDEEGDPKAVRQLANIANAVRSGEIPTAAGRFNAQGSRAAIYPVIVVSDPAMEAFGVNTFLNSIFQQYASGIAGEIRPLTIMSIQELEEVLAHTSAGVFTWSELLDSRFDISFDSKRVRLWSVRQAIYDLVHEKQSASIPNEFCRLQFERIGQQILEKYRNDTVPEAGD